MKQDEDTEWEIVDEIPKEKPAKKPPESKKVGINPSAVKIAGGIAVLIFLLVITKGRLYSLWWFYVVVLAWYLYRRQTASKRK